MKGQCVYMNNHMKLTIITPEKEFYSGEILSLNTESDNGRFGILANHVAMISKVKPTVTEFTQLSGEKLKAFTEEGILSVHNNEVEILCSACEWR